MEDIYVKTDLKTHLVREIMAEKSELIQSEVKPRWQNNKSGLNQLMTRLTKQSAQKLLNKQNKRVEIEAGRRDGEATPLPGGAAAGGGGVAGCCSWLNLNLELSAKYGVAGRQRGRERVGS